MSSKPSAATERRGGQFRFLIPWVLAIVLGMMPFLVACVYMRLATAFSWNLNTSLLWGLIYWTGPWFKLAQRLGGYQIVFDSTDPNFLPRCAVWFLHSVVNVFFWLGLLRVGGWLVSRLRQGGDTNG